MFFVRIGRILAFIGVVLAVIRFAMAFIIANDNPSMAANAAASARYLGTSSTGEAMDQATVWLFVCVALGVLCHIAKCVTPKR